MRAVLRELTEYFNAVAAAWPGYSGYLLRRWYFGRRLQAVGQGALFGRDFSVMVPAHVRIGMHFRCGRGCFLSAEGSGSIEIGDRVAFNNNVHVNAAHGGAVRIGNDVLIGPNCVLRASDHSFAETDVPMRLQPHRPGLVVLEDDVWLGSNVTVLKNVRVGTGAVVAAGAVVTRDVAPFSVVGGVPARFLRARA